MEKVLWEIPFEYENKPFYFTVRKFGFRLMAVTTDFEEIRSLLKKINNAIKIVDRMINPLLKEVVNKGDITFENQIVFLQERYTYFKNKASELFNSTNIEPKELPGILLEMNSRVRVNKEGFLILRPC